MKREEILKKAIERAVKNGFDFFRHYDIKYLEVVRINYPAYPVHGCDADFKFNDGKTTATFNYSIDRILFNHDFAKAFWGKEKWKPCESGARDSMCVNKGWQYHIQQLAIAEDRLEYIAEFL